MARVWQCGALVCDEWSTRVEGHKSCVAIIIELNLIEMKDKPETMVKFVKVVERFPEIYDRGSEAYKYKNTEKTWEVIAEQVSKEIKEECTASELKIRWKGIRSSYSRFKNRTPNSSRGKRKYYLFDTLKFLEPHVTRKITIGQESYVEGDESYVDVNQSQDSSEYDAFEEWCQTEIKEDDIKSEPLEVAVDVPTVSAIGKKRKHSIEDKTGEDDGEDMHFFRSIMPDIKGFTTKQKRKFKMGILRLIDEIDNEN